MGLRNAIKTNACSKRNHLITHLYIICMNRYTVLVKYSCIHKYYNVMCTCICNIMAHVHSLYKAGGKDKKFDYMYIKGFGKDRMASIILIIRYLTTAVTTCSTVAGDDNTIPFIPFGTYKGTCTVHINTIPHSHTLTNKTTICSNSKPHIHEHKWRQH